MKELYNEFFCIPKHGKIREKVMITRVAVIVAVLVICLVAMSATAYAYFTYNVSSGANVIQAASFETTVSLTTTSNGVTTGILPESGEAKPHTFALKAGETYAVTIEPTADSTVKTGFVVVTAEGCSIEYHTQQLYTDGSGINKLSFTLSVTADTTVVFEPRWGTSSRYDANINEGADEECYILQDEPIEMSIHALNSVDVDEDEQTTTQTTEVTSAETTTSSATETTTQTTVTTTEAVTETTTTTETATVTTQTSETTAETTSVTVPTENEILN